MVLLQPTHLSPIPPVVVLGGGATLPRTISVPGATLLFAPETSPAQANTALNLLRGFRATGRRLVWFDTSELATAPGSPLESWGERIVERGGAEVLIITGPDARRAASAARDAGLGMMRVTVATESSAARNLLCDWVAAGDVALLLGVSEENAMKVAERLECQSWR